jgi:fumarate hydratase class I
MADFIYEKPFQIEKDTTTYRLLTKDYVQVIEAGGKKILKVDPKGLELLAKEAIFDLSFYLRASHLEKCAKILKDPEASDNDKFVAYTMLRNTVISAKGELPWCQDTGTAIVIGKKGEQVWTDINDAEFLSKGIYTTYKEKNLRYSQVVPFSMFEEKNSGTNMPAQIDIYSKEGNSYDFLFITKGGGSANKTFLYQQTKSLLNEESLTKFVKEKIKELGTSACPPYHLALVIGGTSAEATLKTVKEASAGYYDNLPTTGNASGRAFRDIEWEKKIEKICQEYGVGAQFGGKYFVHDVRVIRLPRHAASCPVGIGVSCSADRNIKAHINEEGIFLEQLEKNPARFMPSKAPELEKAVEINLDRPMKEVLAELTKYPVRTRLSLNGTLIVARDIAHAQIKKHLDEGKPLPEYFKNHPIYYAGPAKTPEGMPSGSFGPTTAGRMDMYVNLLQSLGGSLIMVAKGNRTRAVIDSCKRYGGFILDQLVDRLQCLLRKISNRLRW